MRIELSSWKTCAVFLGVIATASTAHAFDPANGDYHKDNPKHIRVMTWNIFDGIGIGVDTTPASESLWGSTYAYDYIGRICHAFDPDILCFQEVEPSSNLSATEAALTQWADTYFGPGVFNIYVSPETDGYNRNVTLSKFPFADLNGDGIATKTILGSFTLPSIRTGPGGLPPGGTGGIRGWVQTEIDLPDTIYPGDLFVGNSHLKAGFDSSDFADRLEAAQNIAYVINEALNLNEAAGGDPDDLIFGQPPLALSSDTPVVLCGDFNEDELTNGRFGPVAWLSEWTTAANDGTDRDDTTMHVDASLKLFTTGGSSSDRGTHGTGKLDYVMSQDSITTVVREFIYDSTKTSSNPLPPDLQGLFLAVQASNYASDHYPVITDLVVPTLPPIPGDCDGDGDVDLDDYATCFEPCLLGPGAGAAGSCADVDLDGDNDVDLKDFAIFQAVFGL